jgi:hypothetical protein
MLLCAPARAQVKAVSVASTRDPSRTHGHGPIGIGADLSFGWAGQRNGPSGWSARLDYEILPFFDPAKIGGLVGFMPGFEIWSSGEDNWGFSLPVAIVGGVRVFPFRVVLGGGVDAMLVDQVDDDTGFGMYAPFALGKVAIDIMGAQLGVDARVGYRWQIGAEDHTRWQLSFYLGFTAHPPNRGIR